MQYPLKNLKYLDLRGDIYYKTGEIDKATADFPNSFRLAPKATVAYYTRGIVHWDNGNQAEGEADFFKAKELGYEPE